MSKTIKNQDNSRHAQNKYTKEVLRRRLEEIEEQEFEEAVVDYFGFKEDAGESASEESS